jgi:multidrug efflux pump subunit AcrA (membrane-fusion protein)
MKLIKKYKVLLIIVAIILTLFLIFKPKTNKNNIKPYTIEKGDVEQIIDLSGNIVPASEVNLIFEKTGKVKYIDVKVGSKVYPGKFLASVDNSSHLIQLDLAKNAVKTEEIKLDQLKNGLTDEEKLIQENNLKNAENSFNQSENNFYDSLDNVSVQVDNIIRGKVDQFFQNGDGLNPTLSLVVSSHNVGCCTEQEKLSLNQQRRDVQQNISLLNEYIYKIKQEGITEYNVELIQNELKTIKTFVDNVASAINNTYSSDGSLTSTINS